MAAQAFFDKLPIGNLAEDEVLLVDLFEQMSGVVQRFLPRAISLQTWAERRVPLDKVEAFNGTGLIYIVSTTSQVETEQRAGLSNSFTAAPPNSQSERPCGVTRSSSSAPKGKGTGKGGFTKPSLSGPKGKEERKGGVVNTRFAAPPKGKGERKGDVESSTSSVAPRQTTSTEPDTLAENDKFFNDLPAHDFLPEELDLRETLMGIVTRPNRRSATGGGSHSFQQLENLPGIIDILQALLPPSVSLREWVERRTCEDFTILEDNEQNLTLSLFQNPDQEQENEIEVEDYTQDEDQYQFLSSLPEDEYTQEEDDLREALLSFLETWSCHQSPRLGDAGSDPAITNAEKAFLPEGVGLVFWIQARMGEELELKKDPKGQHAFDLIGQVILESSQAPHAEKRSRGRNERAKRARERARETRQEGEWKDITHNCCECNEDWVDSVDDQKFRYEKNFAETPARCKDCRLRKKARIEGGRKEFEVKVKGLPFSTTEDVVNKDFSECGEIVNFNMPLNAEGKPRGMAFIEYKDKESADMALKFNETDYGGRTLSVRMYGHDKGDNGKGKGRDGKDKGKGKKTGSKDKGKGKGKKG